MEEGNLTLIIVAGISTLNVMLNIFMGLRANRAAAKKDEESVYAGLVDRLETRLAKEREAADEQAAKDAARITALEEKCGKFEAYISKLEEEREKQSL